MIDRNSYFNEHYYNFSEDAIYDLNKQDNGSINNVISRLRKSCFGVFIYDDKDPIEFMLIYIDSSKKLVGYGLVLSIDLEIHDRTILVIEFCKLISTQFPELDIIEMINTYQTQSRSAFEKMGFITFGNEVNNLPKGTVAIPPPYSKGLLTFPTFNKLDIYRWYFNETPNEITIDETKVKKVYLLLDSNNNLIKIGESYDPKIREKTLQGINPDWDIITTWIAPVSEERRLHKLFSHKRTRGEWFKLNFNDLAIIKKEMSQHKKSF
ncbi:MAG: GIY-YIG nuclease family protein [Marinoscillum sp.]|uniref:GIY-YIG nuclease family protein n=1 Tax=Marinoscillum sp. TaxID=2024838 RepID=UPI0032F6891B